MRAAAGKHCADARRVRLPPRADADTQPWRRTISAIHSGANGEVQFGGVG